MEVVHGSKCSQLDFVCSPDFSSDLEILFMIAIPSDSNQWNTVLIFSSLFSCYYYDHYCVVVQMLQVSVVVLYVCRLGLSMVLNPIKWTSGSRTYERYFLFIGVF